MKKNSAIKAGVWYTICNFLVKGLAFLTMPIFTRLMSSNDIGMFSNITSWFSILAIIATFEIYSSISIARFDYKEDLDSYVSSTLFLGTMITLGFYIIVLVFHNFFQNLFLVDYLTLNLMFIYLLVYPSVQMYQMRHRINYEYKPTIVTSMLNAILSTGLSIILVIFMKNELQGRIIGYFVPLIIIAFVIYVLLMVKGKSISPKYWKYALMISFPLIWHLLAGYILSSSDRIMITRLISPDANALYSVSYTISMVVSILWMSMNNAWSPWAYEKMDAKDYKSLKDYSKPYTIFFLIIVFTYMLVTPELLLIMGGKYYLQAKYVMPPVMVGYIFQFVYSLYVNIEFYHKKQTNIAIGTIIAAAINIILNLLFIPKLGYIAAAYTTLVGYMSLFIIHFLFVKKLGCIEWYDKNFFFKVLTISLIFIPIINLLYKYNIIRYILFIVISIFALFFLVKKRKEIINAIKNRSIDDFRKIVSRKEETI